MADRRYNLIDVMRGVKKHKLADKLTDGVYKFLIELILEANELGFKNPIDLTVKQALAIGGGESRQSLYNRRKALKKIMLNGKHLVKINVGSYGQKSLATYQIDYDLLSSYSDVWQGGNGATSNEFDTTATKALRSVDVTLDDPLPILRSEEREKREDVGGGDDNFGWLLKQFQNAAPGWCIQNDIQREKIIEFSEAPREKLELILKRAAERGEKGERLITWVDGGLKDFDRLYNGPGNGRPTGGVDEQLVLMREELAGYKESKEADPEHADEWEAFIQKMQIAIYEREVKNGLR